MNADEKMALLRRALEKGQDSDKHRAVMRVIEVGWSELFYCLQRVLDR